MSDGPNGDGSEQAEAEFDDMASWTADAVRALGPDHAIPAGCRGSGSPAGLRWLGEGLGLAAGHVLLDVGAGVGGPAAYAREEFGVDAVLLDPMPGACQAARTIFQATSVVSPAEHLPVRDGSCEVVWSLGVLCSVDDLGVALDELARVLAPHGRLGILVYIRTTPHVPGEPAGNHFPSLDELDRRLAEVGLTSISAIGLDELPGAPDRWQAQADEVDRWIEREHGDESTWQAGHESEQQVGHLLTTGQVTGHLRTLRPS
ncbi:MAG: class I SAM-dependent methyltransferase [Actinomycetota bacterium]|nr:class I SAM-dependent methyltransferase [Actinomycetota bacterium]